MRTTRPAPSSIACLPSCCRTCSGPSRTTETRSGAPAVVASPAIVASPDRLVLPPFPLACCWSSLTAWVRTRGGTWPSPLRQLACDKPSFPSLRHFLILSQG